MSSFVRKLERLQFEREIEREGYFARRKGLTGASCPYQHRSGQKFSRLRKWWLNGWFAAEKELKA